MTTTRLHIVIATQPIEALRMALAAWSAGHAARPTILLPSSLDPHDRWAQAVIDILRAQDNDASIITPLAARTRIASFLRSPHRDTTWTRRSLTRRDSTLRHVTLPTSLIAAKTRITICNLDQVAVHGPFTLDLLAHYAHPRDRVRLLASGQRSQSVAEVNLAIPPLPAVIAITYEGMSIVGMTSDPIAGELLALALAELQLGQDAGFTGPWEDSVVQRATELDLGVHYPGEIALDWEIAPNLATRSAVLREHVIMRLGLPLVP